MQRIMGGYSLDVVKRKKVGRMIMLGRKSIGAKLPEEFVIESEEELKRM